jgi:hypothetical protein
VNALPADVLNTDTTKKHYGTDKAPFNANPYRPGYELVGWSTDNSDINLKAKDSYDKALAIAAYTKLPTTAPGKLTAGTQYFCEDGKTFVMPDQDLDLYAVWSADIVYLNLVPGDGTNQGGAWTSSSTSDDPDCVAPLDKAIKYYVDEPLYDVSDTTKEWVLPSYTDIVAPERLLYRLKGWSPKNQATYSTPGKGSSASVTFTGNKGQASVWTADALSKLGADTDGYLQWYEGGDAGANGYVMTPYDLTLYAVWEARTQNIYVHYWKVAVDSTGKFTNATEVVKDRKNLEVYPDEPIPYTLYPLSGGKASEVKANQRTYGGYIFQPEGTKINLGTPITAGPLKRSDDGLTVESLIHGSYVAGDVNELRFDLFYIPDPNTPYSIEHWRIDGNGKLEKIVTTKHKWYGGTDVPEINALTDSRLYPAQDTASTPASDLDWKGYTAQLVDAKSYADISGSPTTIAKLKGKATADVDTVNGDLVLVVVYTADPRKLILDLGEYVDDPNPSTWTWPYKRDASNAYVWEYYAPPTHASESAWKTGMTDVLPDAVPVRQGYTFMGWSNVKEGANTQGTNSIKKHQAIVADKTNTLFTDASDSWMFTMPQIADNADGSDSVYRLYAVWKANEDTEYTVLRYRVSVKSKDDGSGNEAKVTIFDSEPSGIVLKGVTDDYIDLAAWIDGAGRTMGYAEDSSVSTGGHMWSDYNDTTDISKVPQGFNFIKDGHKPLFEGLEIGYTDLKDGPMIAQVKATGTLDGDGKLVLRLFYVARPVVVYFNVVDRLGQHAGAKGGHWVDTLKEFKYVLTTDEPGAPSASGPSNSLSTGQEAQVGVIYAGQDVVLPLDTFDVTIDSYTLIGWSLRDHATTIDTATKKNFDVRAEYYNGGGTDYNEHNYSIIFGVQPGATAGTFSYDGKWTVPDNIEALFQAEAPTYSTATHYNLWAVYGMRAQMLIFDPKGHSIKDVSEWDEDAGSYVTPDPDGKWSNDPAAEKYGDPKEPTNLGSYVTLPDVTDPERLGYRLIGWTTDPNYIGLRATGHGGHGPSETGVPGVYEIDYRNPDGSVSAPTWQMPTDIEKELKFYAVWEPLPAVIHYEHGLSASQLKVTPDPGTMEDTYGYVGGKATVSDNSFINKYYEFKNWTVKIDGKTYTYDGGDIYKFIADKVSKITAQDGVSIVDGVEVTLKATWTPKRYEIQYVSAIGQSLTSQTSLLSTAKNLYGTIKFAGATFVGWYTKANKQGIELANKKTTIADLNPNDDIANNVIKVIASWEVITYDVVFDLQGGNWKSKSYDPTAQKTYLQNNFFPKANQGPNREGYDFVGWFTKPNGKGLELTNKKQKLGEFLAYSDKGPEFKFYAYWKPKALAGASAGSATVLSASSAAPVVVLTDDTSTEARTFAATMPSAILATQLKVAAQGAADALSSTNVVAELLSNAGQVSGASAAGALMQDVIMGSTMDSMVPAQNTAAALAVSSLSQMGTSDSAGSTSLGAALVERDAIIDRRRVM